MNLRKSLLALAILLATASFTSVKPLCTGYLPENNLKIPLKLYDNSGITEDQFNQVLDKVEAYYKPVIAARGANFVVSRNWTDDTVNAYAEVDGNDWEIFMYGGLARYSGMDPDGFTLVACHETGHHLGGAPRDGLAVEGEADYYATLDCMRYIFNDDKANADFVASHKIDPTLDQACGTSYTTTAEKNLCIREGVAGYNMAQILKELGGQQKAPAFDTPDPSQVSQTDEEHPAAQCRLDTYFQAGLCVHDTSVAPDDNDPTIGTCTEKGGQKIGLRPRCWYFPGS